jgi:segregation and condensation protein B
MSSQNKRKKTVKEDAMETPTLAADVQPPPDQTEEQAEAVAPQEAELPDGPVEAAPEEPAAKKTEDVDQMTLEALLMATHSPLTLGQIAEVLELGSTKPVRRAIEALNQQYDESNRAFRIEQISGGYQILTLPQFADTLKKMHQKDIDAKLTQAAKETLAIIAYKQPILRADVEAIRGVACGETIRSLMEKHLVKIAGRAEEPGRPILYGTTKRFLESFGLNSLADLPKPEEQPKK